MRKIVLLHVTERKREYERKGEKKRKKSLEKYKILKTPF